MQYYQGWMCCSGVRCLPRDELSLMHELPNIAFALGTDLYAVDRRTVLEGGGEHYVVSLMD